MATHQEQSGAVDVLFVCSNGNQVNVFLPIARQLSLQGFTSSFLSLDAYYAQGATKALMEVRVDFEVLPTAMDAGDWFQLPRRKRLQLALSSRKLILQHLRKHPCRAVVLANDMGAIEQLLIRSCEALGIRTALVQEGTYPTIELPAQGQVPIMLGDGGCELFCAWSDGLTPRLRKRGVGSMIRVTGSPRYDEYFSEHATAAARGSQDNLIKIMIAGQCFAKYGFMSLGEEVSLYERIISQLLQRADVQIVLKLHPQQNLQAYGHLASEKVRLLREGNSLDLIKSSDAFFTISSTTATEAILLDVPTAMLGYLHTPLPDYASTPFVFEDEQTFLDFVMASDFPRNLRPDDSVRQAILQPIIRELDGNATVRAVQAIAELMTQRQSNLDPIAVSVLLFAETAYDYTLHAARTLLRQEGPSFELVLVDTSPDGAQGNRLQSELGDERLRVSHYPGGRFGEIMAHELPTLAGSLIVKMGTSCLAMPGMLEQVLEAAHQEARSGLFITGRLGCDGLDNLEYIQTISESSDLRSELLQAKTYAVRRELFTALMDRDFPTEDAFKLAILERTSPVVISIPVYAQRYCPIDHPEISILLCCYNREAQVAQFIRALEQQSLPLDKFELICVNDGSADRTGSIMQAAVQHLPGVYIEHPKNRGLAAARNSAIRAAKGKLLLFINDDTYFEPTLLEEHLNAHRAHGSETVAMLGDIPFAPEHASRALSQALIQFNLLFPLTGTRQEVPYGFDYFVTGNLSVPRSVFEAADQLFEESFHRYGCEDIEMGYRLWQQGLRVYFHPRAKVRHDHRLTIADYVRREEANNANLVQFLDKHPELVPHYLGVPGLTESLLAEWKLRVEQGEPGILRLLEAVAAVQDLDAADLASSTSLPSVSHIGQALIRIRDHYKLKTILKTFEAYPGLRRRLVACDLSLPDRRSFNFLLADRDEDLLRRAVSAYLDAFAEGEDVALHILAGSQVERFQDLLLDILGAMGRDPERIADINLLDVPAGMSEVPAYLRAAEVVLGRAETVRLARTLGKPAFTIPEAGTLRQAQRSFKGLDWSARPTLMTGHAQGEHWLLSASDDWQSFVSAFLNTAPPQGTTLLLRVPLNEQDALYQEIENWLTQVGYDPEGIPDIELISVENGAELTVFQSASAWIDNGDERAKAIAGALGLRVLALCEGKLQEAPCDEPPRSETLGKAEALPLFSSGAERMPPRVTVVIPCYNYAHYLPEAVESVLNQTLQDFEVIIVNDGSTDDSAEVARRLIAANPNHRMSLIDQANSGQPAIPRNRAIEKAKGEYILCMDADDMIAPTMLEECVRLLDAHPDVSIAYTDQLHFNDVESGVAEMREYDFRFLLHANFIGCCSVFRRKAWVDSKGYKTNVRGYEDWDFWIGCGEKGHYGKRIPKPLFHYRVGHAGVYSQAIKRDRQLRAQIILNHASVYGPDDQTWAQGILAPTPAIANLEGRIVALVAAYNEGDVISHVIGDLIANGLDVYLIDNNSTDDTVEQAKKWLGKGLLHIERFPQDAGYPARNEKEYVWRDILRRKEELSAQLGADWYVHSDADEFRESPWPGLTLAEAIRKVDRLGFNAINFELLNFRPVNNEFPPGADVRDYLQYYEPGESFNAHQIKAWKNIGRPVQIAASGGHNIDFIGRRISPVPFLLRHYPIRSEAHGRRKVYNERLPRFAREERAQGWHVQYDAMVQNQASFLYDPAGLTRYDANEVRAKLLGATLSHFMLRDTLQAREAVSSLDQKALQTWLESVTGRQIDWAEIQRSMEVLSRMAQPNVQLEHVLTATDGDELSPLLALVDMQHTMASLQGDGRSARRWFQIKEEISRFQRPVSDRRLPGARAFNILVVASELEFAKQCLRLYLGAFSESDDIALHIKAAIEASLVEQELHDEIVALGYRPETIPDVSILDGWSDSDEELFLASDLALGDDRVVTRARALGRPAFLAPSVSELKQAFQNFKKLKWSMASSVERQPGERWLLSSLENWEAVLEGFLRSPSGGANRELLVRVAPGRASAVQELFLGWMARQGYDPETIPDVTLLEHGDQELVELFRRASAWVWNGNELHAAIAKAVGVPLLYLEDTRERVSPEMISIVLLGYNQLPFTKLCVESVLAHSDRPFELILVDNGSVDGTGEYFRALAARDPRVKAILNPRNLGFAVGCNQGIAEATGDYVLFLNNDTIVPRDWLSLLLAHFEGNPTRGAVGAVSNCVSGRQQLEGVPVPNHPDAREAILAFGDATAAAKQGQGFELSRLVGFCLMVRREVLDIIGGFDPGYGIGNFEDDDLCLRILTAGFETWVAQDVYVHHFGSRTFAALGIDSYRDTMDQGWSRFKQKWNLPAHLDRRVPYQVTLPAFDPTQHQIPVAATLPGDLADPFRPGLAAMDLPGRRTVTFFHHPDWSAAAWPGLITTYAEAFAAEDDVSLVIWLDPTQGVSEEEAGLRILEVLTQAGLDPEQSPDILLVPDFLDLEGLARLYATATCVVCLGDKLQAARAERMGLPVLEDLARQAWLEKFKEGGSSASADDLNSPRGLPK